MNKVAVINKARFISGIVHFSRSLGDKKFTITRSFSYYSAVLGATVIIRGGFKTDFASIPKFLRGLFTVNNDSMFPAIIHDQLCDDDGYTNEEGVFIPLPQKVIDQVFEEGMKLTNITWFTRRMMFRGVRTFQSLKSLVVRN